MSRKRNINYLYYSESSSENENDLVHDSDLLSSKANSCSNSSNNSNNNTQRRRRGPSKKRPCLNRNALMARKNREKKKEYLESIENKLSYYRNENLKLINILKQQSINLKRLNAEVSYLKNVLKNNTTITALLNSMNAVMNKKDNTKVVNQRINCNDGKNSINNPVKNNMDKELIDDGVILNNEEVRNLSTEKNTMDLLSDIDPIYTSFNHHTDDLFNFEDIDCDPKSNGIISLDDITTRNNNSTNTTTTQLFSTLPLNNCSMNEINKEINNEVDTMNNDDGFDNVFDNNSKCDSNNSSLSAENLFDNLDTSGICLHINAGKISLEFCSICHLNSINSEDT